MCEVVSVLDALVAADDVEQLVVGQEAGGHVRTEEAREAARVREPTGLVLERIEGRPKYSIVLNPIPPSLSSSLRGLFRQGDRSMLFWRGRK